VKTSFLDKLLNRLDRVGADELQSYLQRLSREKGFLETVFNTLQEGIVVIDPEGKILYLNHSMETLLGIAADALGKNVAPYIKGLDWKAILSQKRVVSRDLEVFYPQERLLNFYLVPLEAREGQPSSYVIIFHDITATREKTREAVESERLNALTLLAAGVAHELGNPLNSLHIHFQLMDRQLKKLEDPAAAQLRESLEIAKAEIARLDVIITQFLRAVRPGKTERHLVQVNDVVRESIDFLKAEIADRDILVETELARGLPLLKADAGQLKQAFYNLIKNAFQAMGTRGILRVGTGLADNHVWVSFADNGCGIAAENVARVFDPYFTTKESGSGLGLFIVRRIVREHGGELMLESNPGRGTIARILLPIEERRLRLLPSGEGGKKNKETRKKK
jgi:PAS domain S-box-containing protein